MTSSVNVLEAFSRIKLRKYKSFGCWNKCVTSKTRCVLFFVPKLFAKLNKGCDLDHFRAFPVTYVKLRTITVTSDTFHFLTIYDNF